MKKLAVATCLSLCCVPSFADITFTPRVTYYFDNVLQRTSEISVAPDADSLTLIDETNELLQDLYGPDASFELDEFAFGTAADQISILMYGGSVTFGGDRTQVTLTALYGDTDQTVNSSGSAITRTTIQGLQAEDAFITNAFGNTESERLDIEVTIQRRLNETLALVGGVRYERLDNDNVINTDSVFSQNNLNLINIVDGVPLIDLSLQRGSSERVFESTDELFSARFGASAYAPISRNTGAFLIGMLHASYQPSETISGTDTIIGEFSLDGLVEDETTIGPDLTVGIQHSFSERVSLDLRYRATVYFPVSSGKSTDDSRINHGASLGLSFRL